MLLDVNVLVALAWPNHVHHGDSREWMAELGEESWSTCSITEAGFVRVSSNPSAMPHAVAPAEAIELLRRLREYGTHRFLGDDVSLTSGELIEPGRVASHGQVTDAHLLALARRHATRLVTFDRGIAALLPEGEEPAKFVIELSSGL